MRELTEEELKVFYEKIVEFIGRNATHLEEKENMGFRLHKDRVYYMSEDILKAAGQVGKKELICPGVCFGKFTKGGKFKLHITSLTYLARYAKHKVWVKPKAEMSFLYGNHVQRAQLGKITQNTSQYQGVVVYNMNDLPLGFGKTAKSTIEMRRLDPGAVIVFNQADCGEYLRDEENLI